MKAEQVSVLVVEDEALVRMDLALHLSEAGYRVIEAGSAAEAIEILEKDRSIRAVFTDINMPGDMNGLALAQCVRERCHQQSLWFAQPTPLMIPNLQTFIFSTSPMPRNA